MMARKKKSTQETFDENVKKLAKTIEYKEEDYSNLSLNFRHEHIHSQKRKEGSPAATG